MNITAKASQDDIEVAPTVRAAAHIWGEIVRAKSQRDVANGMIQKYSETLDLLIEGLPQPQRAIYQKRLDELKRETSPDLQRVGEVSANVIELFRRNAGKDLSFSEVQNRLSHEGKDVEAKSVYNTLNYLVKTGVIERIVRGRYRLREGGFGLDADGLPDDGTTRLSEHNY